MNDERRQQIEADVLSLAPSLRYNREAVNAIVDALAPPEPEDSAADDGGFSDDLEDGGQIYRDRHGKL